jgi:hypothetical protein
MSIFVKPTEAPKPRTDASAKISILFAVILIAMAVTQLFTFEDFLVYIKSLNLPLTDTQSYLVAPLIVLFEVFALPFLLRMWLSPAFRSLSMFFGWLAAVIWLCISLWLVSSGVPVTSVGFFGTVVILTPGRWAIFISLALVVLAAWSSWGLWPGKRTTK